MIAPSVVLPSGPTNPRLPPRMFVALSSDRSRASSFQRFTELSFLTSSTIFAASSRVATRMRQTAIRSGARNLSSLSL